MNDYLNNEEETHYKKIIWEEMNREYLEVGALSLSLWTAKQSCIPDN